MSEWVPAIDISVSDLYADLANKTELEELEPYRVNLREFIAIVEKPLTNYITSGEAFSDPPATSLECLSKIDSSLAQMNAYGEEVKARTIVLCVAQRPARVRALNAETTAQVEFIKGLQKVVDTTITSIKKTIDGTRR